MSLESQIGSLVEAANDLTGTVSGKMAEIDQKVDEAVGSVPDTVRRMAEYEFHVDYESGVDDSDRSGSRYSPFKTVLFAVQQSAPGARVLLRLQGEADHICEIPQSTSHHNTFHNRLVEIIGDREKHSSGNPSVLRFRCTPWARDEERARCNFFEGSTLRVAFAELDIVTENKTGVDHYGSTFGGVFTRGTTTGGGGAYSDVALFFRRTRVDMNDDLVLVTGYMGSLGFYASESRINGEDYTRHRILSGSYASKIRIGSSTLEGFGDRSVGDLFGFDDEHAASAISV